jgi:hypothetical protein
VTVYDAVTDFDMTVKKKTDISVMKKVHVQVRGNRINFVSIKKTWAIFTSESVSSVHPATKSYSVTIL